MMCQAQAIYNGWFAGLKQDFVTELSQFGSGEGRGLRLRSVTGVTGGNVAAVYDCFSPAGKVAGIFRSMFKRVYHH
jgi:hypothetical protein